ncbi:DUF6481 family protein [Alsobacter sp. SYSU M60028]|uniref:DUF6481 family protein n=1 Tax=Alsobacter ponti TaxID=2962936 RepID=A0ABT1L8V9_9HYPH|nr:DUF6481 family protein [Alsobacter ponti]MCP8937386.1 DUF6481 family protein [Alsobacter ponti]
MHQGLSKRDRISLCDTAVPFKNDLTKLQGIRMPSFKEPNHQARANQAAAARKQTLSAFQHNPARDPAAVEARGAVLREREQARALRAEEKARLRAIRETEEAEQKASRERETALLAEARAADAVELAAKQKAARDARYSARKARAR